jgi:prepilin-type processing-associated H-X9-DG protein
MRRPWTFWQKVEMYFFALPSFLLALAFLLSCLTIFIQVLASGHHGGRENARRASCWTNLKQIGPALEQYAADYDEQFPLARFNNTGMSSSFGWADVITPYIKSIEVFQCPSEKNSSNLNPRRTNYTDYFFNARLGGVNQSSLSFKHCIILNAEGNDGTDITNARYSKSTLPRAWIKDLNSPANRHLEGANYAFADGHVKWYKPNRIKEVQPNGTFPTFAVR